MVRVALSLFVMICCGVAQAQQADGLGRISALINEGRGEVAELRDKIYTLERRLAEWEASLSSTNPGATPSVAATDVTAQAVARHPMLLSADAVCIDYFKELVVEVGAPRTDVLNDCIDTINPRVRYRHDFECASLFWTVGEGGRLQLEGNVPSQDEKTILADAFGLQTIAAVAERPFPACAAIEALELPMTSNRRPELQMLSTKTRVAFGESLAFEVTTPDFFAYVYVVYLQADGAVVNLTPKRRLLREQYAPNTTLFFGDGREGRQTYTASAPAGSEAIIAVTSRSPIEALDELEAETNGQYALLKNGRPVDQATFLDLLRQSIDTEFVKGRGTREISAEVLHVTVVP